MFDVVETSNFPTEPPFELTAPEDLIEELEAIFVRRDRDEARAAFLLARAQETKAFERDGYSSLTALLKHRMSLHPGEAQRLVRRANALTEMPLTSLAYDRGAISGAQVDVLSETKGVAPDVFAAAEGHLVELAMDTPLVGELHKKIDYWLEQVARADLAAERDLARETRALNLRREHGMLRINGWMDLESGERLAARLDPGPPAPDDTRTAAARRADLLLEMVEGSSKRPGFIVHVSAETLLDGQPGTSETAYGTFLTADEIRRISCDANLTRVVFGPDSQPLDVGRTKRLVTPAMRVALIARDLDCVFPTCDRPSPWCDQHHLVPWAEGGTTSIDNLVLLCRHHHTLVHEGGWKIEGRPGDLHFHRPDGTELGAEPRPRPDPSPYHDPKAHKPPPLDIKAAIDQIRAIPYPRRP